MKIGVTGTREGMNDRQAIAVYEYLSKLLPGDYELHHGDCVGVDGEVAIIARSLGFKVVCHPPEKQDLRVFHESDEFREPFGYLRRDRNIVDETELLLVVPLQNTWQSSGGTWYTHDYAQKKKKPVVLFYPGEHNA